MSDVHYDSEQISDPKQRKLDTDCDAVCINASRIYDSCGSKDCLSDLPIWFSKENQQLINNACSVRICNANIITTTVDVESVAFHRGFYSVDTMYYFAVTVDVYSSANSIPVTITGLAMYGKRAVLFGGEGCVKTFSSSDPVVCESKKSNCKCDCRSGLPKATVQISNPMALSAKIKDCRCNICSRPCNNIPQCVLEYFDCEPEPPERICVVATIGIFTITQLERNVQLMIPSYEFCIPRKECVSKTDDPCEAFSKIEFPTDSFFPPTPNECDREEPQFGCDCCK